MRTGQAAAVSGDRVDQFWHDVNESPGQWFLVPDGMANAAEAASVRTQAMFDLWMETSHGPLWVRRKPRPDGIWG